MMKKMKKIMFYCPVFYPQNSGYSNAFQNLINAILDNLPNVNITVVTPYPLGENKELKRDNLDVIRLKPIVTIKKLRYFLNQWFHAKMVSKKFKSENYDLLFIETFEHPFFIYFLDSDIYKRTIVRVHSTAETEYTMFHNSLENKIRKFMIKKFLAKKVINIASTNSYHLDFVKKYYLNENIIEIAKKNFFIIPNTIQIKDNLDLNVGEKLKIVTLGRMDRLGVNQKGFTDLIYALKLVNLIDQNIMKKFEITIVGKGDERSKILALAKEFQNITFIEELTHSETINLLKEADVVILPSRYEGMSMFALEALATGNVVIFSKTGGLIDLVDGNGYLFEPQNIESLAEILVKISKLSKDEIIKMKYRSIEIVKEKFAPNIIAKKFNFILNIVGS